MLLAPDVSLRDIARDLNISISTVSRALNGLPGLSNTLRSQIVALAAKRGYRPSGVGRALRRSETRTIGLVVPSILNPFFTEMAHAAEIAARAGGYSVIFGNSDEDTAIEDEYLGVLVGHRVDGLLISPTRNRTRTIAALHRRGMPIVFLDRSLKGIGIPCVGVDFDAATGKLVDHLAASGNRTVGVLTGPKRVALAAARLKVVIAAAASAGIEIAQRHIVAGNYSVEGGASAFRELLRCGLPSAIISLNNRMTEGALEMALAHGVAIGTDVALASFDDISLFRLVRPTITAVVQPTARMASVAFELLMRRIGGQPADSVLLEASLAIRASTPGPTTTVTGS